MSTPAGPADVPEPEMTIVDDEVEMVDPPLRETQEYPELNDRGQWDIPKEETGE